MVLYVPVVVSKIEIYDGDGVSYMWSYALFNPASLILASFEGTSASSRERVNSLPPFYASSVIPPLFSSSLASGRGQARDPKQALHERHSKQFNCSSFPSSTIAPLHYKCLSFRSSLYPFH